MADNVVLNPGSGGATCGAKEDGSNVFFQEIVIGQWDVGGDAFVPADATHGIYVQPQTSSTWVLGAGTNEIGKLAAGTAEIGKLGAGTAEIGKLGAGTAEIGKLGAGTALIGKVSIDQSTANANEVVVKSGTVTTVSTVTSVTAIASLGFDNTNYLKTSLYGKSASAADTAIAVSSTGLVKTVATLNSDAVLTATGGSLDIVRASGIATDSGDNTIIAANESGKFRILALSLIATSTTAVSAYLYNGDKFHIGNGTNKLTLDADGGSGPAGLVLPFNPAGWIETDTTNEALKLNLSGATPVLWVVTYVVVI